MNEPQPEWTRLVAWRDTLTPEERARADYMLELEGGNHATALIAVGQDRLERRAQALEEAVIRLEKRSIWKDGLKALGAAAGALVAWYAGSHGLEKP